MCTSQCTLNTLNMMCFRTSSIERLVAVVIHRVTLSFIVCGAYFQRSRETQRAQENRIRHIVMYCCCWCWRYCCMCGVSSRRFSICGAGGMQTLKITGNILMSELSLIRKRNVNDSPWSSVYNLWTNKHTAAEITLCDMNVIAHGSNNLCITCSRCVMLCYFFFPIWLLASFSLTRIRSFHAKSSDTSLLLPQNSMYRAV